MVGALQFEVLMAIVGTEKFSSAIGLVLLIEAIAVLVGPPGAGQSMEGRKELLLVTQAVQAFINYCTLFIIVIFLCSPPGRLLDATHQYMYIFLLAGCEVVLSAFIITLGNFLCISRKKKGPEAKVAASATEKEGLSHGADHKDDEEGDGQSGQGNEKVDAIKAGEVMMLKEMGKEGTDSVSFQDKAYYT